MRNKAGFTLVAAIFILLVMTLLAVTTSTFISSDAVIAVKNYYSQDAFYIASSGMEFYLKQLDDDDDWSSPPTDKVKNFSGGEFVITPADGSKRNRITFTVAGLVTIEGVTYKRMIRPTIQRTTGGLGDILGEYVVYWGGEGGGDSTIGNNVTINGDIFVNGDLNIGNNGNVSGDVYATGEVNSGDGTDISGTTESDAEPPYDPPTLETTYYDIQIANAVGCGVGDTTWDNENIPGLTEIDGNLTVNQNKTISLTGVATVVVTGTVLIRNNARIGDNIRVIAGGLITIQNNVILGKNQLWYSTVGFDVGNNAEVGTVEVGEGTQFITPGNISFGNNIEYYGFIYCGGDIVQTGNNFYFEGNMIVGGDINVDNNTTLILNPDLVDPADIIGVGEGMEGEESFTVTRWEEVY